MDNDGIDDALQGVTQVALTAAGRVGEQIARAREQRARDAAAASELAAREMADRLAAERAAARASLAPVHRRDWWDNARSEDIMRAYQTARAWSDVDPEAVRAEQRIVEEVRARFGVQADQTDPARVGQAIDEAAHARTAAAEQRSTAAADRAEATGLVATAEAADRASEGVDEPARGNEAEADALRADAERLYDSAERREAMAKGLDHVENRLAVDARVQADVAQGKPATEAVTQPRTAPKARRARTGQSAGRVQQRTIQR